MNNYELIEFLNSNGKYEDTGEDEWNVILFVNKTEDINNFTDFLKERLVMILSMKFGIMVMIPLVKC